MEPITLEHPPIVKSAAIRLTRQWSDYEAGNIIITDAKKVANMAKKNYGEIIPVPKSRTPKKETKVETADAAGPKIAEKEVIEPKVEIKEENEANRGRGKKGGD